MVKSIEEKPLIATGENHTPEKLHMSFGSILKNIIKDKNSDHWSNTALIQPKQSTIEFLNGPTLAGGVSRFGEYPRSPWQFNVSWVFEGVYKQIIRINFCAKGS